MHRRSSSVVGNWLALLTAMALTACGGDEKESTSSPAEDTGGGTKFDVAVTPDAAGESDVSVDGVATTDGGATPDTSTPPDGGPPADGGTTSKVTTCNPCSASSACATTTVPAARCADQGAAGGFCAEPCGAEDACAEGFDCVQSDTVEGGDKVKLCLPTGDAGAPGTCTCSVAAIALALSTSCWVEAKDAGGQVVGKCMGKRVCAAGGLSPCDAKPAAEEQCNGGDDDCDGQTDEAGCDDGDPCTTEVCTGGNCSSKPATDACDDGDACTEGEICKAGQCVGENTKDCDDNDSCTTDACEKAKGCTHVAAGGGCDDGDKCTTGETCKEGKCTPGATKTCDDGVLCTNDSCDATTGVCLNEAGLGPCDDGDPCTTDSACGTNAGGKPVCTGGKGKNCDDANPCTTDSCSAQLGCVSKANTSIEVSCYSGAPATKDVGLCKAGVKKCKADGGMGACANEVLPASKETCNGLDDDCNGKTDEGCASAKFNVVGHLSSTVVSGKSGANNLRMMVGGSTVAGSVKPAKGGKYFMATGFYAWLAGL